MSNQIDRKEILTLVGYVILSVFLGWAIVESADLIVRYMKIYQMVLYG